MCSLNFLRVEPKEKSRLNLATLCETSREFEQTAAEREHKICCLSPETD